MGWPVIYSFLCLILNHHANNRYDHTNTNFKILPWSRWELMQRPIWTVWIEWEASKHSVLNRTSLVKPFPQCSGFGTEEEAENARTRDGGQLQRSSIIQTDGDGQPFELPDVETAYTLHSHRLKQDQFLTQRRTRG